MPVKLLQKLIKKLTSNRETKTIGVLLRETVAMKLQEYNKINLTKRLPIQDIVLDSILNKIDNNESEEFNRDAIDSLKNFPKIKKKITEIKTDCEKSELIQLFKDIEFEENNMIFSDPSDMVSTLLKMSFDDTVLFNYLKHEDKVRDKKDYQILKKAHFASLHGTLRDIYGEKFKDVLYYLLFYLSKLYKTTIKKFEPTDIYTGAHSFYKCHEKDYTITFSTSSGLPNPLERFGTDKFIRKYKIPENTVDDIILKNPYRTDNFSKGILNKSIDSKRIYIWEKNRTSEAFKEALLKVPIEYKQKFLDDAIKLTKQALLFNKIQIIEIEKFSGWMRRFTRNGNGELLFSMRGSESKRISHALKINFDINEMSKRRKTIQRIINALCTGTSFIPILGQAVNLLVWGEDLVYSFAESNLTKSFNLENDLKKSGILIKDYGSLNRNEATKKSEQIIESFIK